MTTASISRDQVEASYRTTRPCPVCGSRSASLLHACRYALFDDSALPAETSIVACSRCGLVYADSKATGAAYRRHYRLHSKYDTTAASGSGLSTADAARLEETVDWIGPRLSKSASILDVGAGQGGLLHAFRRRGWSSLAGIDPSDGCVASMSRSGLEAFVGELEDSAWPTDPRRFDCVVLSHVLEHVFDVAAVIASIDRRVSAHGRIYIEVPDAAGYTVDGFPPFYFFDPEHINHFDLATLSTLAERFGWRVDAHRRRDLILAGRERYPAVGVFLARAVESANVFEAASRSTMEEVGRYVAASLARVASMSEPPKHRPVVIWGAGSHAQRLLAQTELGASRIDCIIDNDPGKQGRLLAGHRVVTAEEGLLRARRTDAAIVVAIAVGGEEVVARLRADHPDLPVDVL